MHDLDKIYRNLHAHDAAKANRWLEAVGDMLTLTKGDPVAFAKMTTRKLKEVTLADLELEDLTTVAWAALSHSLSVTWRAAALQWEDIT